MKEQSYYIHPDQLCIGLYVHLDLGWMSHSFTFSNFKIKTNKQIDQIQELHLDKIRYDPLRSDCEPLPLESDEPPPLVVSVKPSEPPPPVVEKPVIEKPVVEKPPAASRTAAPADRRMRSERLKQLHEIIHTSEKEFTRDAEAVTQLVRNLATQPQESKQKAEALVGNLVDSVVTESDVVLHALGGNRAGSEIYVHSLNVTVLALTLAKSLDMSEKDARDLGVAAIFHDIGRGSDSIYKSFLNQHCENGARILLEAGFPERIARIVLQHHEHVDGTGYPKHLMSTQIDPLARLLALVNAYENLCNPANPAAAMTPYETLAHMYAKDFQKYDATLLKLLIKSLGVYPPGSVVQLSDDNFGLVMTVNPDKPLLPFVMIYDPSVPRETPVILDLSEEPSLSIKKCLRPGQLSTEVYDYLSPRKRVCYYFLDKGETSPSTSNGEMSQASS